MLVDLLLISVSLAVCTLICYWTLCPVREDDPFWI